MKIKDIVEARMSAAVKLQRAFEREQSKSTASKERADQAKGEFEKTWKAKQEKEKQGVAEGKADYNFDIEDLKRLERIRDLATLKTQAMMLISKPSAKTNATRKS